jgi:hypothetical protein
MKKKEKDKHLPVQMADYSYLYHAVLFKQKQKGETFKKDFNTLPPELRFFICNIIQEYNRYKANGNVYEMKIYENILQHLDCCCILNYAPINTIHYINNYYLTN